MRRRSLFWVVGYVGVVLLSLPMLASALPDTIMSITPDATDGTTITASDENSRSTSTETPYNSHGHVDIVQTGTRLHIGASSGRSSIGDTSVVLEGTTNNAFEVTILATDPTADITITLPDDDGVVMPDGALIFMLNGSCPPGTTDITATHSNRFIRVNATGGSTGGSSTDTITLTAGNHASHTHAGGTHGHVFRTQDGADGNTSGGLMMDTDGTLSDNAAFTGTISGTEGEQIGVNGANTTGSQGSADTFNVDTVPTFVTAKLCEVN